MVRPRPNWGFEGIGFYQKNFVTKFLAKFNDFDFGDQNHDDATRRRLNRDTLHLVGVRFAGVRQNQLSCAW